MIRRRCNWPENEAVLNALFGDKGQEIIDLSEEMELETAAAKLGQLMNEQAKKSHPGGVTDV